MADKLLMVVLKLS